MITLELRQFGSITLTGLHADVSALDLPKRPT